MLKPNFAVYLGKEKAGGFSGFVAEKNFFLLIEIEEGIDAEHGKEIVQKIKDELNTLSINNLASFDQFISQIITKYNFPTSFSLSASYLKDKILHLKTVGQGKIFLQRGRDFAQIIEKDNSASGYIDNNDFFILTSEKFIDLLGSDLELKTIFDHKDPHKIVEDLIPQLKAKDDEGVITLLIQFKEEESEQADTISVRSQEKINPPVQIKDKIRIFFETFRSFSEKSGKRKTFTFIAVIIIFCILIWSLLLGDKRRNESEIKKKIEATKELVNHKLDQAEETAFLNLDRSLALISEAKTEVEKLKKQLDKQRVKEVEELEKLIKEKEGKIVKKEEKKYEEFYDLTLDNKEAEGSKLYLDKDNLSIIDKGKGTIYILSLSKKSLDKKSASEIKKASLVSMYQDYVLFFVEGEGVYRSSADGKTKKVIENDKDWRNISDMWIYNGNAYLLDKGNGDIYKYLVAESGYSEKSSYLKADAGSIKGANSFAIDGSIYVGLEDHILKYTAGTKDEFSTSWPEKNVSLTKIFTSRDIEKVYGWDKSKGAIYVLGKNGTYEREIDTSILNKGSDFVVFNNAAFILVGEKIYKISLE